MADIRENGELPLAVVMVVVDGPAAQVIASTLALPPPDDDVLPSVMLH